MNSDPAQFQQVLQKIIGCRTYVLHIDFFFLKKSVYHGKIELMTLYLGMIGLMTLFHGTIELLTLYHGVQIS